MMQSAPALSPVLDLVLDSRVRHMEHITKIIADVDDKTLIGGRGGGRGDSCMNLLLLGRSRYSRLYTSKQMHCAGTERIPSECTKNDSTILLKIRHGSLCLGSFVHTAIALTVGWSALCVLSVAPTS